jgi:hypothetical protein
VNEPPAWYWVQVSAELVAELQAAPSRPVTLQIVERERDGRDGPVSPVLELICTEHRCTSAESREERP